MATVLTQICDMVRQESDCTSVEYANPTVYGWAEEALLEHNASFVPDGSNLPTAQIPLIKMLVRIKIADARAAKHANQSDIRNQSGYGTDRNTPYYKNADLSTRLRKSYEALCLQMGIAGNTDGVTTVMVGTVSVTDSSISARTPYTFDETPMQVIVLSSISVGATSCKIQWTRLKDNSATELYLYGSANALLDVTNFESTTGIPKIADLATKLRTTYSLDDNAIELTGLTTGQPYHLLVVYANTQGRYGYSNELIVTPA